MKGILAGILVVLAFAFHASTATPVTIRDLNCATDFLVQGDLMDDLVPAQQMNVRRVTVLFQLNDADLAAEVYVKLLTDTVNITAYQASGATTGRQRLWADIQDAIVVQPGSVAACLLVPGCDGFIVDSPLLLAHFPVNATKLVFAARVQYAANFTSTVFQGGAAAAAVTMGVGAGVSRRLLSVTPDNATIIGETDVVTVDLTFTDAIHSAAFNPTPSSDNTLAFGLGFGIPGGLAVLLCAYCAMRQANKEEGYGKSAKRKSAMEMKRMNADLLIE